MKQRARLGEPAPPLDVGGFEPAEAPGAAPRAALREAALDEGWAAREPRRPHYSRRTGRTAPIGARVRPEVRARLQAIADDNRWGIAEALERIIEAYPLQRG